MYLLENPLAKKTNKNTQDQNLNNTQNIHVSNQNLNQDIVPTFHSSNTVFDQKIQGTLIENSYYNPENFIEGNQIISKKEKQQYKNNQMKRKIIQNSFKGL